MIWGMTEQEEKRFLKEIAKFEVESLRISLLPLNSQLCCVGLSLFILCIAYYPYCLLFVLLIIRIAFSISLIFPIAIRCSRTNFLNSNRKQRRRIIQLLRHNSLPTTSL